MNYNVIEYDVIELYTIPCNYNSLSNTIVILYRFFTYIYTYDATLYRHKSISIKRYINNYL